MKKSLSIFLICLLLIVANFSVISAQTRIGQDSASVAEIKADVAKYGTGEKKRVQVKLLDGQKIKGNISQVGEDSFTLTDSEPIQLSAIAYSNVAEIKRDGKSKKDKVILGIVLGTTAVVAIVAGKPFFNSLPE